MNEGICHLKILYTLICDLSNYRERVVGIGIFEIPDLPYNSLLEEGVFSDHRLDRPKLILLVPIWNGIAGIKNGFDKPAIF